MGILLRIINVGCRSSSRGMNRLFLDCCDIDDSDGNGGLLAELLTELVLTNGDRISDV